MKIIYIMILIVSIGTMAMSGCPTCVGQINKQSAPFFSDECYNSHETTITSDTHNEDSVQDQEPLDTDLTSNPGE